MAKFDNAATPRETFVSGKAKRATCEPSRGGDSEENQTDQTLFEPEASVLDDETELDNQMVDDAVTGSASDVEAVMQLAEIKGSIGGVRTGPQL
ncbi:hypothetical protein PRNP1_007823 [Phytophthora ramorum]